MACRSCPLGRSRGMSGVRGSSSLREPPGFFLKSRNPATQSVLTSMFARWVALLAPPMNPAGCVTTASPSLNMRYAWSGAWSVTSTVDASWMGDVDSMRARTAIAACTSTYADSKRPAASSGCSVCERAPFGDVFEGNLNLLSHSRPPGAVSVRSSASVQEGIPFRSPSRAHQPAWYQGDTSSHTHTQGV